LRVRLPCELLLSRADESIQSHCEPNQNAVGKLKRAFKPRGE
jgi:hypothetical protein